MGHENGSDLRKIYDQIAKEEHHFNTIQAGLRGIASAWLLATLGATAFIFRSSEPNLVVPSSLALAAVTLLGSVGILTLSTVDLVVYQRLLNAAFTNGLVLGYRHHSLPPIRTAMMYNAVTIRFLGKQMPGMSPIVRLFYIIPSATLTLIAVTGTMVLDKPGSSQHEAFTWALIVGEAAITASVYLTHRKMERGIFSLADAIPVEYFSLWLKGIKQNGPERLAKLVEPVRDAS